jgi:hypothetical protein
MEVVSVKLLQAWRGYKYGAIVQMQPNIARFLISAGVGVEFKQPRRRRKRKSEEMKDGSNSPDR